MVIAVWGTGQRLILMVWVQPTANACNANQIHAASDSLTVHMGTA